MYYLNTSHVILYQVIKAFKGFNQDNLNTSHVILYPWAYGPVIREV